MSQWGDNMRRLQNPAGSNRGMLFGSSGGGAQKSPGPNYAASEELMESANQESVSMLSDKVKQMKALSRDINATLKEDNDYLAGMANDMDGTGTLLTNASKQLDVLVKSSGGSHMCYLAVFIVFVFILLYKLFGS